MQKFSNTPRRFLAQLGLVAIAFTLTACPPGSRGVHVSAPRTSIAVMTRLNALPDSAHLLSRSFESCPGAVIVGSDRSVQRNGVPANQAAFFRMDGNAAFEWSCNGSTETHACPAFFSSGANTRFMRITTAPRGGDEVIIDCFEAHGTGSRVDTQVLSTRSRTDASGKESCDRQLQVDTIGHGSTYFYAVEPGRTKTFRAAASRVRWNCPDSGGNHYEYVTCPANTDAVTVTRERADQGDDFWIECYE